MVSAIQNGVFLGPGASAGSTYPFVIPPDAEGSTNGH